MNKSMDDLQLSLLMRSGTAVPVGTVPAFATRTFVVAGSQLGAGDLQLLAGTRSNPNTRRSAAFTASVGQRIEWVIDYHLASEVVIVR